MTPSCKEIKLTSVFAADLSDLDSVAPPVKLDTSMMFTVQPRTDPKDLKRKNYNRQERTNVFSKCITSETRLTSPGLGLFSRRRWPED